jgi:NADH-quinone oxidoreductase subunit J
VEFLAAHGGALLFYLFALLAVAGALLVIILRNPMYGAFALLVSFLAMAGLFLLQQAEFVGIVQIFVYGGGIMVLFLFVIMLVNLHQLPETGRFLGQSPLALVLALTLLVVVGVVLAGVHFGVGPGDLSPAFRSVDGQLVGNTEAVAMSLYRQYLLPFEIASIFLLVAMIGAVVLGRRQ